MLKRIENFLLDNEILYFDNVCSNIVEMDDTPTKKKFSANYYNRHFFNDNDDNELNDFMDRIKKHVNDEYSNTYEMSSKPWINVINNETNKNDPYHFDIADLTIVIYLNENFVGGEFLYKEGEEVMSIEPKKNLALVMDSKLLHKVKSVDDGIRYSLICFFNIQKKTKKTLL